MKKIVYILFMMSIILSFVGCKKLVEDNIAEVLIEKNLEATGLSDDVDVSADGKIVKIETEQGVVNLEENQGWPSEIPKEIPVFDGGEVVAYSRMNSQYVVSIYYDDPQVLEAYIKKYEDWNLINSYEDDVSKEVGKTFDNGEYMVNLLVNDGDLAIMVGESQAVEPVADSEGMNEIDFSIEESFDVPVGFPEFSYGREVDVEIEDSDFPNAYWVKKFVDVEREDFMWYLTTCQDRGYKVDGFFTKTDELSGMVSVRHTKVDDMLALIYDESLSELIIAAGMDE